MVRADHYKLLAVRLVGIVMLVVGAGLTGISQPLGWSLVGLAVLAQLSAVVVDTLQGYR